MLFTSRRICQKSKNNKVSGFLMSLGFQKQSALKDLERIIPEAKRMGAGTFIIYSWIPLSHCHSQGNDRGGAIFCAGLRFEPEHIIPRRRNSVSLYHLSLFITLCRVRQSQAMFIPEGENNFK